MKRSTARALDRTVLLSATLCLAGKAYNVPSKPFWDAVLGNRSYLILVFLAIAGVFGALAPFESWHARTLAVRNVVMRRSILSSFGKLLAISEEIQPPLETGDLALHVWRKRRTARHPIQGVLKRIATYRMANFPVTRTFAPVKGVGVVGLCWQYDREFDFDVGPLVEELTNEAEFDRFVEKKDSAAVMNLSWEMFDRVKHRTAVFATPIRDGHNRFVGCISLDASHGYSVLNRPVVLDEMTRLGIYIGREDFECT